MGDDEVEKYNPAAAAIFKALGDENRWRILETLKEGERCACVLLTRMQIGQSTLSHHMKVLCDCGLVNVRKEGKWSHYSLNCETLTAFRQFIDGLVCRCAQDGEEVVK